MTAGKALKAAAFIAVVLAIAWRVDGIRNVVFPGFKP